MKNYFLFLLLLICGSAFAAEAQTQTQPQSAPASKTYHHPTGLEFTYPADWSVQGSDFAEAELVPADQQKNDVGITEGFFLWGLGGKFTGAADPKLVEYANSLVVQIAPFLKQDGEPVAVQHPAGPAMRVAWSGAASDGKQITSIAFIVTRDNAAFVFLMLGNRDRMELREPLFRGMFDSARFAAAPLDPLLFAQWKTPAAAAQSQTQPQPQTQDAAPAGMEIALRPDGTFTFTDLSAGPGEPSRSGNWYASGGRLCFVIPESYFLDFTYVLSGPAGSRKLFLHHSSGGTQELREAPLSSK